MTSSFDDRKNAFENKFKVDEEFRFRVNARAVRLFGNWAAIELGISGDEAEAYAEEVVDSDFHEPGYHDVIRKVLKDFADRDKEVTEHHLEKQFLINLEEAKKAMA